MGLISDDEEDIDFIDYRRIENGYVIFHREYFDDLRTITGYLRPRNAFLIGRYGRWTYNAMEDAILDGREAASTITGG